MFIVPLFPALFANRLLADRTSHTRGSAPLLPILCTQFSSELLSVTHPAITPRYHPKTHPHVGTLIRRHTCSAFVLHSYFCFLRQWMRNTCGDSLQTKKTFVAIAWDKRVLSHKVRSFVWFTIPLETNSVVHYRQCQIYLKVVTARMVIQISFPLFWSHVTFDKKTHHNIRCVDYPVQCPEENSQVVSICADCRRVVCTIPIISVNGIVISDVIRLHLWSNNSISCTFPSEKRLWTVKSSLRPTLLFERNDTCFLSFRVVHCR
jgi:hypothetical protein